jgi:hypothetical protein
VTMTLMEISGRLKAPFLGPHYEALSAPEPA